jgi:DNA-binding MarR family transcriptional regulator
MPHRAHAVKRKEAYQMAGKRRLANTDYQRLGEFRQHLRQFLTFSEAAAVTAGLTPQQHQALLAIKGAPEQQLTAGQLAHWLGIKHHSAVGLIDRLSANALVERHHSTQDRRQVILVLTTKAEDLLAELSIAHRTELERLAPLLRTLLAHFETDVR